MQAASRKTLSLVPGKTARASRISIADQGRSGLLVGSRGKTSKAVRLKPGGLLRLLCARMAARTLGGGHRQAQSAQRRRVEELQGDDLGRVDRRQHLLDDLLARRLANAV